MTWCSSGNERTLVKKTLVAGAVAVVAVFAGVMYFAREPASPAPVAGAASADEDARAEATTPAESAPQLVARNGKPPRPATTDPRLAALMVSPANDLIEFFTDPGGKVIKEIDNDPASMGYRKPLREYTYAGDKVIRLVSYRYLGEQVQIVTADVAYKPDGSVDKYSETTSYENGPKP
jgi:hypothetical protein